MLNGNKKNPPYSIKRYEGFFILHPLVPVFFVQIQTWLDLKASRARRSFFVGLVPRLCLRIADAAHLQSLVLLRVGYVLIDTHTAS